jgi:hypothetical protein
VVISNTSNQVVASFGSGASPMPAPMAFTWATSALPPGDYIINATVQNDVGCVKSDAQVVSVIMPVPCCIAPQSPVLGPTSGKLSNRGSDVLMSLVNNCLQDVKISAIDLSWTNLLGFSRMEHFCYDVPATTLPEDCTPLVDLVPPQISPVSLTFGSGTPGTELDFTAIRTGLDPLILGFQYDLALVSTDQTLGETLTMDVFFQTQGAVSDNQCRFQITTNPLSVVVVE